MSQAGYLGIDLGTSSVKVLVQDADGRAIAKAQRAYQTINPQPGWAEQSPSAWWQAVCEAVTQVTTDTGSEIQSVGLSGQLNGFVLLDADLSPLANAVIWLDLRAEAETREVLDDAGLDFKALTGNQLSAICVLPKLIWSAKRQPALLDKARHIVLAKDYILLRLTGELATDPSDAGSTAMAGLGGKQWLKDACALAGLEVARLPAILPSASVAGRITAKASGETGLAAGMPVATGAGDVAALAVGCGIVEPGRTAITLGTAGHVVAQAGFGGVPDELGLWAIPHAVPNSSLSLGLIMAGGLSLAWLRQILAHGDRSPEYAALEKLAQSSPIGARGVSFLPFLEGVATPYRRPDARGAFFGLSSAHESGDMVRAVMEGVAFNARECVQALAEAGAEPRTFRVAEGGTQSDLWCQIMADVLGETVATVAERDTSAAGAAMLGRTGAENACLTDIVEKCVLLDRQFHPDPQTQIAASEAFERYGSHCRMLLSV